MTARELIETCRRRDIHLRVRDGQLDVDAPRNALTDAILQQLRGAKAELVALLDATQGRSDETTTIVAEEIRCPTNFDWPGDAADFCLLLTVDDLPPVPFMLNRWTMVADAGKMLKHLQADIRLGPHGPRAKYGAIQGDIIELKRFVTDRYDRLFQSAGDGSEHEQD